MHQDVVVATLSQYFSGRVARNALGTVVPVDDGSFQVHHADPIARIVRYLLVIDILHMPPQAPVLYQSRPPARLRGAARALADPPLHLWPRSWRRIPPLVP